MRDFEAENRELRDKLAAANKERDEARRKELENAHDAANLYEGRCTECAQVEAWREEETARAKQAEKERDDLKAKVEAARRRVEEFVRRFKAYNDGGRTRGQWERLCDLVFALSRAPEQRKP